MIDGLITIIKDVGFPIAAFLLMFWLVNSTMKKQTEALEKLKDAIENFEVKCPYVKSVRRLKK